VRQPLIAFVAAHPGLRVLPDRFMAIEQAMAIPKGRDLGARYLRAFVEEMKETGFVAKALAATGQADAAVAPPYPLR
jgi:polar amino acid transport system substrate-binding protein